jgi:3,4-dihydroxy 2-butanone 4-phosphate synthase/GTP cyclohydrolase II
MASPPMSRGFLSSPEELIDEARNGRMFILVDDEDRENEGDLVIPAQMATPDAINFMAKYGRGLICLALAKQRVEQLGLQLMSRHNGTRHETAFTTSIEAREGVTTGISAADRARTISVAIDAGKGPEHIVTPGHVFPLVAKDGGVLIRAGHTEAAVDISRLAGLNPSGVICEIMKEDGSMARMDDLVASRSSTASRSGRSATHRLSAQEGSSRRADRRGQVRKPLGRHLDGEDLPQQGARQRADRIGEGGVDPSRPTLVRMHALSLFSDTFGEASDRSGILQGAMKAIAEEGSGVIVALTRPVPISAILDIRSGKGQAKDMDQLRDYGGGAQILSALGIHDMILLTNTHHTPVALGGYGLTIVGERPIPLGGA